jgi:hypothetical protein
MGELRGGVGAQRQLAAQPLGPMGHEDQPPGRLEQPPQRHAAGFFDVLQRPPRRVGEAEITLPGPPAADRRRGPQETGYCSSSHAIIIAPREIKIYRIL